MSLHAITGVMGSGKSHEAVKEKILPALRDDDTRRVVTNVEGLQLDKIATHLNKPLADIQRRLVCVSYERVSEAGFWYDPESGATQTVVQPGDLVVLDEMWRYFNRDMKIPPDAMRFFRMHRHYSHPESGTTCDVVLINQAMRGIHKDISDVVEVRFECRKLKVLGRPQNYQVNVIEGGERNASHSYLRAYDKAIFPLYSSYTNANAKELVDKRQSALSKPFFKFVLPLALVAIIGGVWYVLHYFNTLGQPKGAAPAAGPAQPVAATTPAATQPAPPRGPSWRVVGRYTLNGLPVVVVVDDTGRYRTVTGAPQSTGAAGDISITVPPEPAITAATAWTGTPATYTANVPQGSK